MKAVTWAGVGCQRSFWFKHWMKSEIDYKQIIAAVKVYSIKSQKFPCPCWQKTLKLCSDVKLKKKITSKSCCWLVRLVCEGQAVRSCFSCDDAFRKQWCWRLWCVPAPPGDSAGHGRVYRRGPAVWPHGGVQQAPGPRLHPAGREEPRLLHRNVLSARHPELPPECKYCAYVTETLVCDAEKLQQTEAHVVSSRWTLGFTDSAVWNDGALRLKSHIRQKLSLKAEYFHKLR